MELEDEAAVPSSGDSEEKDASSDESTDNDATSKQEMVATPGGTGENEDSSDVEMVADGETDSSADLTE